MATDEVSYIIRAKDSFSEIHKKADSVVNNSAKVVAGASVAMAASIAVTTVSLVTMVKTTADSAHNLADLENRLGVSAEGFSSLAFAAERSGISITTLETSLQRQTRRLSEAAKGTGVAVSALNELGLTAQELKELKPEEAFIKLAAEMEKIPSKADRARIAMQLWDTEGVKLNQLIAEGTENIAAMREEAILLGLTFDSKTAAASARLNDEIILLGSQVVGLKNTFSKELIPFFGEFTGLLNESLNDLRASGDLDIWAAEVAEGVIVSFGAIAETGANLPIIWQATMVSIKTVSADAVAILDTVLLGVEKFYDVLGALPGDIGGPYREVSDDIRTMRESLSDIGTELLVSADASEKAGEEWAEWQLVASSAIDSIVKKSKEAMVAGEAISPGAAVSGEEGEETSPIAIASADAQKIIEINRVKLETLRIQEEEADLNEAELSALKFTRAVQDLETDKLILEEKGLLTQELNAEFREVEFLAEEAHERRITALLAGQEEERLSNEESIAKDSFNLQNKSASDRLGIMGGFFNDLFIASGESSRELFELSKVANISQALIDTYAGASRSLAAYAYPYNVIAAGLTIAAGLAHVATISGTSFGSSSAGSSSTSATSISTDSVSDTNDSLVGSTDEPIVAAQEITIVIKGEVVTAETIDKLTEPIIDGINRGGLERDLKINVEALGI